MTEPEQNEAPATPRQVADLKDLRRQEALAVAPIEARLKSAAGAEERRQLKEQIETIRKEYRRKRMQGEFGAALRSHDLKKASETYGSAKKHSRLWIVGAAALAVVASLSGYFFYKNAQVIRDGSGANPFSNLAIMNYVAGGVVAYKSSFGEWPSFLWEVAAPPRDQPLLTDRPSDGVFRDAWGNPIIYLPYDPKSGYGKILSLGRDCRNGGEGHDADLEVRFNESGVLQ